MANFAAIHDVYNAAENKTLKHILSQGYDSEAFVEYLEKQGIEALIPSKANELEPRKCDWVAYKERHLIECFLGK